MHKKFLRIKKQITYSKSCISNSAFLDYYEKSYERHFLHNHQVFH